MQRNSSIRNIKKTIPRYIITQLLKTSDEGGESYKSRWGQGYEVAYVIYRRRKRDWRHLIRNKPSQKAVEQGL